MTTIHFQSHHFRASLPPDEARELFRTSVRYVEIETFTYCNRRCYFCPNATIPQRQDKAGNIRMPAAMFSRICADLASVDYRGDVQFGRYNEPLADRIILERIAEIRHALPKAFLYSHTNGDFLTRQYLDELRVAGLNGLEVQTYLGNDSRWNDADMAWRQQMQLRRLGLKKAKTISHAPGFRFQFETDYLGMLVRLDARNFDAIGTDRGGLVQIQQDRPRVAPCLIPFERLYIDYDGSVVPCCNIRSDRPEHADFVVARLQDGMSIFDAFVALHGWRKSLMRFGPKGGPCSTCRYDETEVSEEMAPELGRIYELAAQVN